MTNVGETIDAPLENGSCSGSEDKGHTFRKRRLSLTNLRQYGPASDVDEATPAAEDNNNNDAAAEDIDSAFSHLAPENPPAWSSAYATPEKAPRDAETDANVEEEKAHSFRKRRLSLTHKREEPQDVAESNIKRRRRGSDASSCSIDGATPRLHSRTVHAAELLAHPPTSPGLNRSASVAKLYTQSAPPQQKAMLETIEEQGLANLPKWRKRHTRQMHEDERKLPFPRDIVGTFSCHGVEPIYAEEDAYRFDDGDDDAEEDSDEPWVGTTSNPEKPSMAAKINQDRGGVAFPYGNCAKTALFAVYDGHGQGGELVSQFALHEVQRRLEKHSDFSKDIENAFKETFVTVDESLKEEVLIEPLYAGTTACVALLRENKLFCANSGDSRAVLARKDSAGVWDAINLTVDQNPDLPAEQTRIEDMGGYVSPPPEPGLSARVWLDAECTQIGLAMARSIGDHAVKQVGVIAEPVVSSHEVTKDDEFVIFATDGVWEFLSSEEAVKIVADNLHRGATEACKSLIEAAAGRWHDEEGDYRDDITALVVRLQHLWNSNDAPSNKVSKVPEKPSAP